MVTSPVHGRGPLWKDLLPANTPLQSFCLLKDIGQGIFRAALDGVESRTGSKKKEMIPEVGDGTSVINYNQIQVRPGLGSQFCH